jgi:hypothetical protein
MAKKLYASFNNKQPSVHLERLLVEETVPRLIIIIIRLSTEAIVSSVREITQDKAKKI